MLEVTKKAPPARNGQDHTAQFAQHFVPFLDRNLGAAVKLGREDVAEALHAMMGGWQRDGVQDPPPQHHLDCLTGGAPLLQFLYGDGVRCCEHQWLQGGENLIHGMEQVAPENGVRGERIGHCCCLPPRRHGVPSHLCAHHVAPTAPLCLIHTTAHFTPVRSSAITQAQPPGLSH